MTELALDALTVSRPAPPPLPPLEADVGAPDSFGDCLCRLQPPVAAPATGEEAPESNGAAARPVDRAAEDAPVGTTDGAKGAPDDSDDASIAGAAEEGPPHEVHSEEHDADEAASAPEETVGQAAAAATAIATAGIVLEAPPAIDAVPEDAADGAVDDTVDGPTQVPGKIGGNPPQSARHVSAAAPTVRKAQADVPSPQERNEVAATPPTQDERVTHVRPTPGGQRSQAPTVQTAAPSQPSSAPAAAPVTDPATPRPEAETSKGKAAAQGGSRAAGPAGPTQSPESRAHDAAEPLVASVELAAAAAGLDGSGDPGATPNRTRRETNGSEPAADGRAAGAAPIEPSGGERPTASASSESQLVALESSGHSSRSAAAPAFGSRGIPGERVLTDVELARFVQRVARAFHTVGEAGGSVRLRLSPPELGSLRLEVALRDGVMHARLEAETPGTRTLLLDSLPALRERLAQQDIRLERFDVDLMGQPTGGSPQQPGNERRGDEQSGGGGTAPRAATRAAATDAPRGMAPVDGRLNVLI